MLNSIDVVFSFDTTGSMYPCLSQVRRYVEQTTKELFKYIPELRIGIIAHGDYCDSLKVNVLDLSNNQEKICKFIRETPKTGGGDMPECYELVLHKARSLSWTSGKHKALVLIGDDEPHPVGYTYGGIKNNLDWKNEAKLLRESGVKIYPVQALGYRHSAYFYKTLAEISNTPKLDLEQFAQINDLIKAVCFQQAQKVAIMPDRGGNVFIGLLEGKTTQRRKSAYSSYAVHPSRFQRLYVDKTTAIQRFVTENDLVFNKGRGFYQFTKPEIVQERKEVILRDKRTGEMFSGPKAREIAGLPPLGTKAKVKPEKLDQYEVYIQSTSYNRKLTPDTHFLYEINDWRG